MWWGFIEGVLSYLWELCREWSRKNPLIGSAVVVVGLVCSCWAVCILAGFLGGFGPQLNTVSGKVELDGAPLKGAVVAFKSRLGERGGGGITGDDGRYEVVHASGRKGLAAGEYSVEISTGRFQTTYVSEDGLGERGGRRKAVGVSRSESKKKNSESDRVRTVVAVAGEVVPDRYNSRSSLTYAVQGSVKDCDWRLFSATVDSGE